MPPKRPPRALAQTTSAQNKANFQKKQKLKTLQLDLNGNDIMATAELLEPVPFNAWKIEDGQIEQYLSHAG